MRGDEEKMLVSTAWLISGSSTPYRLMQIFVNRRAADEARDSKSDNSSLLMLTSRLPKRSECRSRPQNLFPPRSRLIDKRKGRSRERDAYFSRNVGQCLYDLEMWILVHSEGQEREILRQVEHTSPRHHGESSRLGLSEDARSNIWSSVSRGKRRIGAKRALQPSRSLRSLSRRSLIWRNKGSTLCSSRSRFSMSFKMEAWQTSSDENPDCRSSVALTEGV